MGIRLGIDIGGTFTDFIALDSSGAVGVHKTPSTPHAPEEAVFTGLGELAEAAGASLRDYLAQIELVIHGMTIATNTIIERSGPKTAVIHTDGFRDILEFRDGYKPDRYNLHMAPREPFVPRQLRLGVAERILHTGAVDAPLDEDGVRDALRTLRGEGVEAVAVCLLWSMVNDVHERRVIELIAEELPEVYATSSAEILPTIREYPRASATVLSAYVGPRLGTYLDRLADHLAEHGYERDLLIMQVTGGIAAVDEIKRRPVFAIGSGPAAGPSGGGSVGLRHGERDLLVIDMGGTSFEVSVVTDGEITLTREMEVGGVPLGVAGVDVQSVGAGGGSVAWIDAGGMLRVGPRSAGADPGPACYGRGGEEPTVTDANLVLGYLNPDFFLGGRMRLDRALAERALRRIAEPLDLSVTEAAAAVFRIVNTNMMGAVRAVTVMRGIDPRTYAMVTGGGAGGIHAAAIAEELGITKLIAPRVAGGLCAYGMVVADVRHSHVTTEPMRGGHFDAGAVAGIFSEMEASARQQLAAEGFDGDQIDLVRSADCKYPYQTNDITITLPDGIETADIGTEITELFHQEHERRYSYAARQMPVDAIAWRLTGIGRLRAAAQPVAAGNGARADGAPATREVFFVGAGDYVATPVLDGEGLHPGQQLAGPVIAEFPTTTVLVPPGHSMAVAAGGDLIIEKA